MTDENQIEKDALWEFSQAQKSVKGSRDKLGSMAGRLSALGRSLDDVAFDVGEPYARSIRRPVPVLDREKASSIPTSTEVLQAYDDLERDRVRLERAQEEAKRLGID